MEYFSTEGVSIQESPSSLKELAVYGALALEMGLSVGVATVIGHLLDLYFETTPVLTLVFLLLGCVAGVVNFIKLWNLLKSKI